MVFVAARTCFLHEARPRVSAQELSPHALHLRRWELFQVLGFLDAAVILQAESDKAPAEACQKARAVDCEAAATC